MIEKTREDDNTRKRECRELRPYFGALHVRVRVRVRVTVRGGLTGLA